MTSFIQESNMIEFTKFAMGYFEAVSKRDYEAFTNYFHDDLYFEAVLPREKIVSGVNAFKQSQKFWFEGKTGKFDAHLKDTVLGTDLGYVKTIVNYSNLDDNEKPFTKEIYISALFKKYNGKWCLIHIQNTVLNDT